jgi:hypothetical protein
MDLSLKMDCYLNKLLIPYACNLPNEPMTFLTPQSSQEERFTALKEIGYTPDGYIPYYGEKLAFDAGFYHLMNHALVHGVNKYDLDVLLEEYDDLDMYPDWGTWNYESFDTSLRYLIGIATGELFRRDPYLLRSRASINPPNRLKF